MELQSNRWIATIETNTRRNSTEGNESVLQRSDRALREDRSNRGRPGRQGATWKRSVKRANEAKVSAVRTFAMATCVNDAVANEPTGSQRISSVRLCEPGRISPNAPGVPVPRV